LSQLFSENGGLGLDTRVLSDFLIQLNIARRHFAAYPRNHPILARSAAKALEQLRDLLLPGAELAIGVARDALLVGDTSLDKENPVFRDLATALFDSGIAVVTFNGATSEEELLLFNGILVRPKVTFRGEGQVEQLMAEAGVCNITVRSVRYDSFHITEEERIEKPAGDAEKKESAFFWEAFAQGLMTGRLDPAGQERLPPGSLDPEILAAWLNSRADEPGREENYEGVIASFLRATGNGKTGEIGEAPMEKLSALVNALNPDLRRQFLRSTLKVAPLNGDVAEKLTGSLSAECILEALAEVNAEEAEIAGSVWGLLQRLSRPSGTLGSSGKVTGAGRASEGEIERWKALFGANRSADFVPDSYRQTLGAMVARDLFSGPEDPEIAELKKSLAGHPLELQFCNVILQIMQSIPTEDEPETGAASARNLGDLCGYFLEVGDFSFLAAIHGRMQEMKGVPAAGDVLALFEGADFVRAVIDGSALWGKGKYPEIRRLIRAVGPAFVEPLLDRLAEEPNISLRRFLIEALIDLGEAVRGPAIARLTDERWYLVRNLVLILRSLGDPEVLRPLHCLLTHPHVRVRQELLKTFLYFGSTEADRLLLEDLCQQDRERQLMALQLAEKSRSRKVFEKILELLRRKGLSGSDLELKIVAIRTLGHVGNPEALPEIEKLLWTRNLLFPRNGERLRMEAARSLGCYPAESTREVIRRLVQSGPAGLAALACREKQGEATAL
jgi:hypothetical protein